MRLAALGEWDLRSVLHAYAVREQAAAMDEYRWELLLYRVSAPNFKGVKEPDRPPILDLVL